MKKNERLNSENRVQKSLNGRSIIYILPIVLILTIVPLIVRLKVVPLDDMTYLLWNGKDFNTDFFSYHKGIFLMILTGISILVYFFTFDSQKRIQLVNQKEGVLFVSILVLLVIFSSLLSSYTFLSIHGSPDRYEGMYIWICYLVVFFYAMGYVYEERSHQIVVYSICVFIFVMGMIGVFQYVGKDLFGTQWMASLIIPGEYEKYKASFTPGDYGMRTIYGTAYHYNYMGSLAPMLFAFTFVLMLFHKHHKIRIFSALASLVSLFLLFGSNARSGVVALVVFVASMIVFFFPKIITHRKVFAITTIFCIALMGIFLFGNQKIFHRLPSLFADIKMVFVSESDYREHYREKIFLKDVRITDSDIFIETLDYHLRYTPKQKFFYDEKNKQEIPHHKEQEKNMIRLNEPYQNITFSFFDDKKNNHRYIKFDDTRIQLYFRQEEDRIVATNPNGLEISLDEAPAIGFVGKEKIGSSRGYIWSRTLPLLFNPFLLGHGADSFLAIFPQGDIYAKLYAYDYIWMIVDKPHNLYLQMAVNFGILFLLCFVFFILYTCLKFFKSYYRKSELSSKDAFALACFMGVISYLAAGIFNDSVLSVAPIFWVLFGFSVGLIQQNE